MPKVYLTLAQRKAALKESRNKAYKRRLRDILEDRGIKQKELALRIGVAETTLCNWNKDSGKTSVEALRNISDELDLSDEDIVVLVRGRPGKKRGENAHD